VKIYVWISAAILMAVFSEMNYTYARTEDCQEIFFRSNQACRADNYQEAIEGYNLLIASGCINGHIYYNLGNAYFREGRIGHAVLNYERARLLIPRDADLNFNLRYAKDRTQDAIPESGPFINNVLFWIDSFSAGELLWCFSVLNLLFWAVMLTRLFRRSEWSYYVFLILLVLWLAAGASFGFRWHQVENDKRAVIVQAEVDVLAGPDSRDTTLFKLHEGAVVHNERQENGWYLISLPDRKRGWIPAKAAEMVKI